MIKYYIKNDLYEKSIKEMKNKGLFLGNEQKSINYWP